MRKTYVIDLVRLIRRTTVLLSICSMIAIATYARSAKKESPSRVEVKDTIDKPRSLQYNAR